MRIAFIGGTRFIGAAATAAAVARGHSVATIHRGRHRCKSPEVDDIIADRRHPEALIAALRAAAPEVIVDTRAMVRPDAEVTALALAIVSRPCVVLSSIDVYAQFGRLLGLPAPKPTTLIGEDAPLTVPYPYRDRQHEAGDDYDKKLVEEVFERSLNKGVPAITVLRLPGTYGNGDPRRRFGFIVDAIDAGLRVFPCADDARWRVTYAHVHDIAHAIVLAAERINAGHHVFNVGECHTPTMKQRVEALALAMGVSIRWQTCDDRVPTPFEQLGVMPNDVVIDSSAIRQQLGFTEVTRDQDRLADQIAWLRTSRETQQAD